MDGQHQEEATDGTYLAIISNYFQPNHAKPRSGLRIDQYFIAVVNAGLKYHNLFLITLNCFRCVGSISIAKPALCSLRRFADRVFIDEVDGEGKFLIVSL